MWALLSDPGHAAGFDHLGEAYAPLRRLVEHLAGREYAGRVYAFQSAASFNLTTAPTSQEIARHDQVGIEYIPDQDQGVFRVGYGERTRPNRGPRIETAPSRTCEPQEVEEVIDRSVRRLLLFPPLPETEPTNAQCVLILVMIAALFVFAVCCALGWAGLPVERVALLSVGVAFLATSLLLIGEALNPKWAGGRWTPRPGTLVSPPNRLTSLGFGIWFGAGGVAFLGFGWLTEHIVWGILGAFAAGLVLALVGGCYAQRRGEAARGIHLALLEYADRHDGWFPRGEASPEASLSLLHRENPGLVTANHLRGRTAPEAAVRARLEAGELLTPETCGWHYAEGLRKYDDPRLALFWDKAGASRTDALLSEGGHFVFFLGGSIEYVPGNRWEEFLAEQEWLRAGVMRSNQRPTEPSAAADPAGIAFRTP
jgi:hypothetical protein